VGSWLRVLVVVVGVVLYSFFYYLLLLLLLQVIFNSYFPSVTESCKKLLLSFVVITFIFRQQRYACQPLSYRNFEEKFRGYAVQYRMSVITTTLILYYRTS